MSEPISSTARVRRGSPTWRGHWRVGSSHVGRRSATRRDSRPARRVPRCGSSRLAAPPLTHLGERFGLLSEMRRSPGRPPESSWVLWRRPSHRREQSRRRMLSTMREGGRSFRPNPSARNVAKGAQRRFCFVAHSGLVAVLPLSLSASTKRKRRCRSLPDRGSGWQPSRAAEDRSTHR